ncbi:MAG: dephospho-CoA kinase [Sphaerochaetaceae bacterium]|nr:dephospho-CoA kinase [Sphaerochaetaceae bacterium]
MIIGIIGRSCSGKDCVADYLEKKGIPSLNCDKESHDILSSLSDEIRRTFGDDVMSDGKPDRKKLAPVVFSDEKKLEKLEELIYPLLIERIKAFDKAHKVVTVNGATLEKANLVKLCKEVIFVYAPLEQRLDRALKRENITKEGFLSRNLNQKDIGLSLFEQDKPVYTILNDADENYLYRQVQSYYDRLCFRGYLNE